MGEVIFLHLQTGWGERVEYARVRPVRPTVPVLVIGDW